MENLICTTKRKKRKTRRCLDEIRSRLRRKNTHCIEHIKDSKQCIMENKKLENRLVTMDRLTLKTLFPKAIRSDTITRPVLQNILQKCNIVSENVRNENAVKNIIPQEQDFISDGSNNATPFHNLQTCDNISLSKENNCDMLETKPCVNLSPFSPQHVLSKAITPAKTRNEHESVSFLLQTSMDLKVQHYKQLMQEVSFHVRHLASSSDRKNMIKSTIHDLQKAFMESVRSKKIRANAEYVLGTSTVPNQLIVENPIDYIRLESNRQAEDRSPPQSHSEGQCPAEDTASSPPSQCFSPPDVHISVIPFDTPDYNYYPHQLK